MVDGERPRGGILADGQHLGHRAPQSLVVDVIGPEAIGHGAVRGLPGVALQPLHHRFFIGIAIAQQVDGHLRGHVGLVVFLAGRMQTGQSLHVAGRLGGAAKRGAMCLDGLRLESRLGAIEIGEQLDHLAVVGLSLVDDLVGHDRAVDVLEGASVELPQSCAKAPFAPGASLASSAIA